MALAISTGFVVDDAIVVLENITRHLEQGMTPVAAAFRGAREIGFTVLSMSTSLVAVFIPILMMGGIVGRLFREFAVTLSIAIGVSLLVSLTTTPMMCAQILKPIARGEARKVLPRFAGGFRLDSEDLPEQLGLGVAPPAADAGGHHRSLRASRSTSTSRFQRDFSRSRTPVA